MNFVAKEKLEINSDGFTCNLSVFSMHGDIVEDYPSLLDGYIFYFTYGKPILVESFVNKASLKYDWKYSTLGELEDLKIKLENIKNELFNIKEKLVNDIDQFGYIYLFIVPQDKKYSLVVASDTFNVSELITLP